jgi:hypothetical protein
MALGILWLFSMYILLSDFGQSDFYSFFPWLSLGFGSYAFMLYQKNSVTGVIVLGLSARLMSLFFFPALSDDIYRFFWDGSLLLSGHSPYGILPADALRFGIDAINEAVFSKLNSPEYYTIYPPVSQGYFAIASLPGDVTEASFILKVLFLCTEMAGLYFIVRLLQEWDIPTHRLSVWWLNPLVIIEAYGNLHFEMVMWVFLVISVYGFIRQKMILSGLFLALSVGVKLLPLMLLPWFLMQSIKRKNLTFTVSFLTFSVLIFWPVVMSFEGMSLWQSVDLYFRKFEFNASIYYILRYLGQVITGYNLIAYIGPLLGVLTLFFILKISSTPALAHSKSIRYVALFSWTVYLILATTVHPWYVLVPLGFSVFTSLTYPVLWSYLAFWSYSHYMSGNNAEHYGWITTAYAVLFLYMILEMRYIFKKNARLGKDELIFLKNAENKI